MKSKKILSYLSAILPAAFLITIFILPIGMESINLFNDEFIPQIFPAFKLPFWKFEAISTSALHFVFWIIYTLPVCAAVFIASLFFPDKITKKTLYFSFLICLSLYLFCFIASIILCANTSRWFSMVPKKLYLIFFFAFIVHACLCFFGINYSRLSNSDYAEYKRLQTEKKLLLKEKRKELKEKQKGQKKSLRNLFKKPEIERISIKTKLLFSVIGTIAILLFTFASLILRGYKSQITEAVGDIGRSQSEQTAAVYESAEGEYKKITNFFRNQRESNKYAGSPYDRIDIIISSKNEHIYLEDISSDSKLPDFDTVAYTTTKLAQIPKEERTISFDDAHEYIKRYQNGTYTKSPVYNKKYKTCKFIYPVTLSRQAGSKLVGFAIVTYREEVLMKHYFHTKVLVLLCSAVFLYISIIISLFLADYITNPLIFLRSNVRKTSESIKNVISGEAKMSPDSFNFEDTITTKDEIKELSEEIENSFSLIRGIVPYISFSTLKHADRETKLSRSRDLCFLFTDIRGFTTLCEGRSPKEVVEILNHYLDIETEIILNNGGDIDKFVGDEMMAFFEGPKKEYNACKAAMEIRAAMRNEQEQALSEGNAYISMGIGINTGKVTFGSVGSKLRMDFTSIGDTVNLAARLEGANKAYGSKAIITEAVYTKLKKSFVCRELDFITVKGKTEPVRIYEILQTVENASDKLYEIKELFEKGLTYYRKQNWEKAESFFKECNEKFKDSPSQIFLERIEHFKLTPPPKKWDGVFVMTVK